MKRPAGSEFDDEGTKWFQSPQYKEVKTEISADENSKMKEFSKRFSADTDKEAKLKRERFYDLFTRISNDQSFNIDIDGLNITLNIRIEEFPDDSKITGIFEELNSKSAMISRGKKNWSEHETFLCIWIVMAYSHLNDRDSNDLTDKDWDAVARAFPGKTAEQCKVRWQGLLKTNLTKAPWTQEEDKILMGIIQEKGPKKWKEIACELNKKMIEYKIFRQGKQCRERWINHLDPAINRGAWSNEEDVKLLETHLSIGKKWAEISKVLKNRTENAVKNRWNSLMKKYKGDFGMDIDTLSASSGYSNKSMDNLEKKIAEMIISSKKGKSYNNSPDETSPCNKILEVNEEDSPDYQSDFSVETPLKSEDSIKYTKREDEFDKSAQRKGANNKKKPAVHTAKSLLRDMITEEIQNQPQTQSFQPSTNSSESSLSKGEKALSAQKMYAFDENNAMLNSANQEQIMSSQGPYNSGPMPLFSQHASDRQNMISMSSDLNMWRNNLNVFNQAPQPNNMPPNFFGLYSPGSFLQHPGFNLSSAILPVSESHPDQNKANNQNQQGNRLLKLNEARPEPEPAQMRTVTLTEKPVSQLPAPEAGQSGLFYAVVDLSGGHMYLLDQISKDNYPPALNQIKQKSTMETSLNNLDFFGNSPALNHASWKSPPINTSNLINYPLFNNLTSFGLPQNQFSPNLNLFQREHNFFESTPKMEGIGGEWTPESVNNRPLFSGLNMKQYMGYGNPIGDTPPDMKLGNGAFIKRMDAQVKPNSGTATEAGKYSSPSSFLTTSQPSNLNRKTINTGYEKQ